ncbi:ArsR/SmtB family transcription factor [Corynebacterium epidermidicanis]|uniref:Putative transcriptional regulator n=1 Tax=Corynebacterium epidermidicanis TaxID=1050174 RepID=A0A0G3GR39_9CORY|nr:metalloregulator ArsR/SmtB family transcription factor [Corynebacterium epidermidicanis]AKK03626.1 putative transcriptional regulator [Corynebacterium epidermidicanis]
MAQPPNYDGAAILMRALDSKVRMRILHLLQERTRCVHELVELLDSSQPLVSQHLRVLKNAGLVDADRRGREMYYSLSRTDVIPILDAAIALMQANTKTLV